MKNLTRKEKQFRVCIGFDETGDHWSAIRSNQDGIPLAIYESSINRTIEENVRKFSEWMKDVEESIIVMLNQEKYYRLLKVAEQSVHPKQMDYRLMRTNQWNVSSDFSYRYQYKKNLPLEMMLLLCELDQVDNHIASTKEAFNILSLTNVMNEDKQVNERLLNSDKRGSLVTLLEKWNHEKLFKEVVKHCPRVEIVNMNESIAFMDGADLVATTNGELRELLVKVLVKKMEIFQ